MLQNYCAHLSNQERLTKNVYRFEFKLDQPKQITFSPGQYLLLDIKQGFRQYSISSSNNTTNKVETIVDLGPMGIGSQFLLNLKIGEIVNFRAPMGEFTLKQTNQSKVFMATGAGISPIKAMILNLSENNFKNKYILLWGLKHQNDTYLIKLWSGIKAHHPNFDYYYCLSKETVSKKHYFNGHVQEKLTELKTSPETEYYLCGRQETVEKLHAYLQKKIMINNRQIFYEKFK